MAVTIRLRKMDFTTPAAAGTLALQQTHGSSCRAYWLKQALVAAGWTVYYSSTGTTTGSSDLWTSSAFQAILMQGYNATASTLGTVDGVWCCLRSPDVDANGDYLHICLSPSQAQWYNPAVRGPTNDIQTYGMYPPRVTLAQWYHLTGASNGFLRLGMALSSSSTAFSGGAPYVSTDTATARGTLPSATGAFWTTHNLGSGSSNAATVSQSLTVLTEGNQFHVLQESATTFTAGYRNWWSVCSMVDGGYAVVEHGVYAISQSNTLRGKSLLGGRLYNHPSIFTEPRDTATELGGWRTGYIKKIGGTIYSGGLACPEPQGFESVVDGPTYDSSATTPSVIALKAISCSDPDHYDLGDISDFVMLGNTLIGDRDRLINSGASKHWYSIKDYKANLLKWDINDNPISRVAVIP